jgi:putative NADPH-quinone reductase
MNILFILGHPDPGRLNHAIAHAVKDGLRSVGHEVMFHDLCEEGFPPLLASEEIPEAGNVDQTVEAHCDELASADGIVILHPNWWGQPPASLNCRIGRTPSSAAEG